MLGVGALGKLGFLRATSSVSWRCRRLGNIPFMSQIQKVSSQAMAADLESGLIVTKSCARRIRQLQGSAKNDNLALRVLVESGGCSGFQYIFKMEEPSIAVEDIVFERDGSKVVVDQASLEFIKGATLDFVQEMIRSSFAILNNPQSESACGCGSSFAVKNFAANPAKD